MRDDGTIAPDPELLALAEARVPRYTSYPTAAQFGTLDEAAYRAWLAEAIAPADVLSLYLHVPFCRTLCWYCGCHTKATRSERRIAAYAASLAAEADLLAAALPAHGGIAHLHLGGGTPSMLGAAGLVATVAGLKRRFGLRAGAEIAIELDPRLLEPGLVAALAAAGFNRASLGVQDIAPEVQARIGRMQPADLVALAVERLRRAGIAGINLDLMYGLPGQTAQHAAVSARFAAALGADRVAVFGYAHVPWMKPHQAAIAAAELPGAAARMAQAAAAEEALLGAGYVAIGLDHYARPGDPLAAAAREGRLRRNFQGYMTDAAPVLLGLGASAIGQLRAGFAQNEPEERRYAAAVAAGRLPVVRGRAVTVEDRRRGAVIERLMCDFAVTLPAGLLTTEALARLAPLRRAGLATLEGERLAATAAGRRFVRQVAACFDAYLPGGTGRHAAGV